MAEELGQGTSPGQAGLARDLLPPHPLGSGSGRPQLRALPTLGPFGPENGSLFLKHRAVGWGVGEGEPCAGGGGSSWLADSRRPGTQGPPQLCFPFFRSTVCEGQDAPAQNNGGHGCWKKPAWVPETPLFLGACPSPLCFQELLAWVNRRQSTWARGRVPFPGDRKGLGTSITLETRKEAPLVPAMLPCQRRQTQRVLPIMPSPSHQGWSALPHFSLRSSGGFGIPQHGPSGHPQSWDFSTIAAQSSETLANLGKGTSYPDSTLGLCPLGDTDYAQSGSWARKGSISYKER